MGDKLVSQLKQELEMDDTTALLRQGQYLLRFDGDVDLEVTLNPSHYLFKTVVGKCPEKNLDSFLLEAAEANLFFNGTRGAAIGYNEPHNMLTLSMEVDYNCGYKVFREKVEDFVSSAVYWKEKMQT